MYHVFVYGSLKKNFGNHVLLSNSKFVGNALTFEPRFKMISLGSFPGVYDVGNDYINGEIYLVDDNTLRTLDRLESEGSFYARRNFKFNLENGESINAFMYILLDDFGLGYSRSFHSEDSYLAQEANQSRSVFWSASRNVEFLNSSF